MSEHQTKEEFDYVEALAEVARLTSERNECLRVMKLFGGWAKTINEFDPYTNTPEWLDGYNERFAEFEAVYDRLTQSCPLVPAREPGEREREMAERIVEVCRAAREPKLEGMYFVWPDAVAKIAAILTESATPVAGGEEVERLKEACAEVVEFLERKIAFNEMHNYTPRHDTTAKAIVKKLRAAAALAATTA